MSPKPPTQAQKLALARINDADAASYARDPQHGPLPDDLEPDAYDLMMLAPDVRDFEPCDTTCDSQCPCRLKPPSEDD